MKKEFIKTILTIAVVSILFSCNSATKQNQTSENKHQEAVAEHSNDCDHVHWSHHEGGEGPENWKNLCDGFLSCGGEAQSPINITTTETEPNSDLTALTMNYSSSVVDIINNGHTVQFNTSGDNAIIIGDKEYKLLQFHYHALSEHTINKEHFPIEVHFVHKHSDTDYAVLGVMFEEGNDNTLLSEYLEQFPASKGSFSSDHMIELKKLFPDDLSYYYYKGSLTTPPCSEVVNWYVLKSSLEASKEQIAKFSSILQNNYRPVMPINDRKVYNFAN